MAEGQAHEQAAIPKFMATRWGTALKVVYGVTAILFGIAAAIAGLLLGVPPPTEL